MICSVFPKSIRIKQIIFLKSVVTLVVHKNNCIYYKPSVAKNTVTRKTGQPQKLHFNLMQLILWCLHFIQCTIWLLGFRMCLVLIRMVFGSNNCILAERGETYQWLAICHENQPYCIFQDCVYYCLQMQSSTSFTTSSSSCMTPMGALAHTAMLSPSSL